MSHSFPLTITPILTPSESSATSTLIKIAGRTFLFDCGLDYSFSSKMKESYRREIENIKLDAIFLSSNDISSIGGLPLVMSFPQNRETPIYSTYPIAKLGVYIMIDAYISALENQILPYETFDPRALTNISKYFFEIKDLKYQQSVEIPLEKEVINIFPVPLGNTVGGTAWKITYQLYSIVYAPQFSIESKLITNPFNYKDLKHINLLITDTLQRNKLPLVKSIVESEFKQAIANAFKERKNVYIPCDSINFTLELLIRIEKIIQEYSNKVKIDGFKVLVCNYCSNEITEGVKSSIEFVANSISQEFNSKIENPFSFKNLNLKCVKSYEDFIREISEKNLIHIALTSLESMEYGLSYKMIEKIVSSERNILMLINEDYKEDGILEEIIKEKKIVYKKIKVIERIQCMDEEKKPEEKEKQIEQSIIENEQKVKEIEEKEITELIRKKMFSKGEFMMFNFGNKMKFSDYGIELTTKDLKIMDKMNKMRKNDSHQSDFQMYLNKGETNSNNEIALKASDYTIPSKFEVEKMNLDVLCQKMFFPLKTKIDALSKSIILQEISPSDGILFLGGFGLYDDLSKYTNYKLLPEGISYQKSISSNILHFNYDSSLLSKGRHFLVGKNQNVFDFEGICLHVKRKREEIVEVKACDIEEAAPAKFISIDKGQDDCECFYEKDDLRLIAIKRELEKLSSSPLFIWNHNIVNVDKTIKIRLNKGELVLEGNFSEEYIRIRNYIYETYFDVE